ncbi:hypothetical protein MKK88_10670 [Methylobacterium sp. E-005]|uniref:hypothetical protein n=1 Tax=Methylobacterium sp. E-005 TaxID=2836549 RepID=UPI001FBA1635|nr:hypothetical protein [Methylobacterium sp. E-005]MCJ2086452.1 hypothetical protein [Methylobacterium sp. E-005]
MGVAILAPVPAVIIDSAMETCAREGVVAFGTNAFEVFHRVEEEYGTGIPVIIKPTSRYGDPKGYARMSFSGKFERFTKADRQGLHPEPEKRPAVTLSPEDPDTPVYGFWEISNLRLMPNQVSMGSLRAVGKKTPLPATYKFQGPLLVVADFL